MTAQCICYVARDPNCPAAERRRIHATFIGRHNDCTKEDLRG